MRSCTYTIPLSWFSKTDTIDEWIYLELYYGDELISESGYRNVVLHQEIYIPKLKSVGMVGVLSRPALRVGEIMTLKLYAHTGESELGIYFCYHTVSIVCT